MTDVAVVAHEGKLRSATRRALTTALDQAGLEAPWTMISKAKKATGVVRRAVERGAEVVMVCGGDGTVRAAAEALVDTEAALAVIPAGTANLFANAFSIPSSPAEVVDLVVAGKRRRIDSGVGNGLTFNVMAGVGFDAAMIDDADQYKGRLGMLAYVRSGVHNARRRTPFAATVTVDDAPFFEGNVTCVLVGNIGTLKGGLTAFPDASPTDGRLDIAVVTAASLKEWAGVLVSAARGKQASSGHAHIAQGSAITVELDARHRYELDGGCKGTAELLEFTVRPASLTICAPEG